SAEKVALEAQDRLLHDKLEAVAVVPDQREAANAAKSVSGKLVAQAQLGLTEAEPGWPEGIFEDSEAPVSDSQFLGTNRWVGTVAERTVAVYAGQAGDDPSTGRLLVMTAVPSMGVEAAGFTVDLPGAATTSA
ncbi:MAG: hypothetical protein ACYDC9_12395, partial [Dermatophilaceae bacterium]